MEVTEEMQAGDCPQEYTLMRIFRGFDNCGNETMYVQNIYVVDTTAPTFTVPADITIECDVDNKDVSITGDVTDEADNCATGLEATWTDAVTPGSCADNFIITRTWTLVDECGNTTTADQIIGNSESL